MQSWQQKGSQHLQKLIFPVALRCATVSLQLGTTMKWMLLEERGSRLLCSLPKPSEDEWSVAGITSYPHQPHQLTHGSDQSSHHQAQEGTNRVGMGCPGHPQLHTPLHAAGNFSLWFGGREGAHQVRVTLHQRIPSMGRREGIWAGKISGYQQAEKGISFIKFHCTKQK